MTVATTGPLFNDDKSNTPKDGYRGWVREGRSTSWRCVAEGDDYASTWRATMRHVMLASSGERVVLAADQLPGRRGVER